MMPMCQNCTKKHCEQPPIERDIRDIEDNDSDDGFDDVDRSETDED